MMELTNYVQENAVTSVVVAGAVVVAGVICANFQTVKITFRDLTAFFEKKPDPPVQVIPPTKAENIGNVDEVYEAALTNQKTNNSDVFNIPAGTDVINAGNVKKVFKEKVDGVETKYNRNFDFTKVNSIHSH